MEKIHEKITLKNIRSISVGQFFVENVFSGKNILKSSDNVRSSSNSSIENGSEHSLQLRKVKKKSVESIKKDLIRKVVKLFETYRQNEFDASTVELDSSENKINAEISCVLCQPFKKIRVYFHIGDQYQHWVLSNLSKHLSSKHKSMQINKCDVDDSKIIKKRCSNAILEESVANEKDLGNDDSSNSNAQSCNENALDGKIYKQLCDQNMKMINNCLERKEREEIVPFNTSESVTGTVRVVEMEKDGNCLFSAFAHQLYSVKANSTEHVKQSQDLRRRAVDFIKKNITDFQHDIIGRTNKQDNISLFLTLLQTDGFWGGLESLRALSIIFDVNIIIFNEKGDFYSAFQLKSTFTRLIMLSYRCADPKSQATSSERNHYDSITRIEQENIFDCTKRLIFLHNKKTQTDSKSVVVL